MTPRRSVIPPERFAQPTGTARVRPPHGASRFYIDGELIAVDCVPLPALRPGQRRKRLKLSTSSTME